MIYYDHVRTGGPGRSREYEQMNIATPSTTSTGRALVHDQTRASPRYARIITFRAPPPRGRILIDLAKAELDVHEACTQVVLDDTGLTLDPEQQRAREVSTRIRAVRLAEQCIVVSKRSGDLDFVEEAAVLLFNLAIPLLQTAYREKVAKSFAKTADALAELGSCCFELRVKLHYESARTLIASDLLTKGRDELYRANALDSTLDKAPADVVMAPANEDELGTAELDPAPFVRPVHTAQLKDVMHLLKWKLALYDDPEGLDQVGDGESFLTIRRVWIRWEAGRVSWSTERLVAMLEAGDVGGYDDVK